MAKVIKAKGDAGNIPEAERAPVGLFVAKATQLEAGTSNNTGNPQLKVVWRITAGVEDGKRVKLRDKKKRPVSYEGIFYYAPLDISDPDISPGWARRLKDLLTAYGLPMKGANLGKIEDKEALIRLREGTDQVGDYRPEVAKVMALSALNGDNDEDEEDEEEPEDEEDEDVDDDEEDEEDEEDDEDDEDEEDDEEPEEYTKADLKKLSNEDLKAVAEDLEVEAPKRLTASGKIKLINAILEAQEAKAGGDEEDEDDEDEGDDFDEMSRKELRGYIKENELDVKVTTKMSDDDVREAIRTAESEDDEEDDDEDEDEPGDNYDDLSIKELRQECEDRELSSKGKSDVLVARLRKDDKENPV